MRKHKEIDSFALCASPLAAPIVIFAAGLLGGVFISNIGFFNLVFWKLLYAFEYGLIFYAITIPVCLLVNKFIALPSIQPPSLIIYITLSAIFVGVSLSAPFFTKVISYDQSLAIMFLTGVILNVLVFIRMSILGNTNFNSISDRID